MRKNIARMAAAERFAGAPVVFLDKTVNQAFRVRQFPGLAELPEDCFELLFVRAAQQHLVLNAAQKRFIAQLFRLQVGRKDQEGLERNRHLAAAC